ncbi:MAG TPA: aldo/keto reductase [Phycisphaerae bacterium]|nr:aldo/keto reductase [Phycisphaerae bacterium]
MAPLPRFTPRRTLGRTGFIATQIGCGDLADRSLPLEQCIATARRALDAGINLIDTAPSYEDGYSEQIVGTALRESGLGDQIFLIDKIDELDDPVAPQIDASLQRLSLPHTDAFVLHGLSTMDGWHHAAAPGGSLEQLAAAIRTGKTRFRGISSHHPDVLAAAIPSGLIDFAMFPIGPFVDDRYVTEILPLAKKHGIGTVCFKTFGAGKLLGDTEGYQKPLFSRPRGKLSSGGTDEAAATLPRLSVEECLHYTLTLDPDVALLGMSFPNEQDAAGAAFHSFTPPLPAHRMQDIRRRAVIAMQGKGRCWWNPQEE